MPVNAMLVEPVFNRVEEYPPLKEGDKHKIGIFIDDVPLVQAIAMGRVFGGLMDIASYEAYAPEIGFVMPRALRDLPNGDAARAIFQTQVAAIAMGYAALRETVINSNPDISSKDLSEIMEAMQMSSTAVNLEFKGSRGALAVAADAVRRAWPRETMGGTFQDVAEMILEVTGGVSESQQSQISQPHPPSEPTPEKSPD